MNSRARKLPRYDNDREAIQKQLNNDFEVQQYLIDQQTQHNNTDAYASLLNSLILHKRQKLVRLRRLKTSQAREERSESASFQYQFGELEEKTGKEHEIKKNLERQIVEIKKSLNLLKGDIGHLVLRNESSQLLGSKVSKAKIVAEDQLKRVTLALAKDRQEIKLRNQMQKKFNKKLKNVSSFENTGLTRAKNNHVESQLRKEEVYRKLQSSQQTAQNGQQMAILQTIKEQLDAKNLWMVQSLYQLSKVAIQFSIKNIELPTNIAILHEKIKQFTEKLDLPISEEVDLSQAIQTILEEYYTLIQSTQAMSQFYQSQLKVKDELIIKMQECQQQQQQVLCKFQLQMLQHYIVSDEEINNFNHRLKKNSTLLKTFFVLLTYLQQHLKKQEICAPNQRKLSNLPGYRNYPYVTQLHRIYNFLASTQPKEDKCQQITEQKIQYLYDSLLYDVQIWLKDISKNINKEGKGQIIIRKPYIKQTGLHRTTQLLEPIPSCSLHDDSTIQKQSQHQNFKQIDSNSGKAKRIKLLQDVDINYYKMIKATMKMEKENTRKNYEFLRTWKRAKYASRDQILEEKRFEASFSVLCSASPGHKPNQSRLEERPLSRQSKTIYSSTLNTCKNTWKQEEPKVSTPGPNLKKTRSSIFERKQKKSRLTDKLRLALEFS